MKLKKTLIFLAILILIFSQSIFIFAETSPITNQLDTTRIIGPQWDNTNDVELELYFRNNNAECIGKIEGVTGTSNISATFKLEKKGSSGWTLVDSWTKNVNGQSLSFYETTSVTKGTYRLSVTAKVTVAGKTETVTTSYQATN